MGVRLTVPEPTEIAQDGAVVQIKLVIPHAQTVPGEIHIVKHEIRLAANVATYSTDGRIVDTKMLDIKLNQIPTQGISMLKQLYEWVEAQAVAQGLIGDGTPEVMGAEDDPVEP